MSKQLIFGLLTVIAGLAGGLLGRILEEHRNQPNSIFNRYGLVGAIAALIVLTAIDAWLKSKGPLGTNWRWHRFLYLRSLKKDLMSREAQVKFSPLDFSQSRQRRTQRPPSAQVIAAGARQDMVQTLYQLITRHEGPSCKVLVLGEPGSGKTTGIERLTLRLAIDANRTFGLGKRIPVLAHLGKYTEGKLLDFVADSMEKRAGRSGKRLGAGLGKLIEDKQIILLFDSLDEALGDRREVVRVQLKELVESKGYENLPVAITSRTRDDPGAGLSQLEGFEIQDLSDDAVRAFIKAYKRPDEDEKRLWDQLARFGLLEPKGLGRNPFWLGLIVESSAFQGNKGELLNNAVDRLLAREWDERPENKQAWERVLVRDEQLEGTKSALACLAYQMSLDNIIAVDSDRTSEILTGWAAASRRFKVLKSHDVVMLGQDAQLLKYRVQERIGKQQPLQFRHRLLQEFLTAWAMYEDESLRSAELLEQFSGGVEYWETLLILGGIIQDRSALVRSVLGDGSDNRRLLLSIGLLHSGDVIDDQVRTKVLDALVKSLLAGVSDEHKQAAAQLSLFMGDSVADAIASLLYENISVNVKKGVIDILGTLGGSRAIEILVSFIDVDELAPEVVKALIPIGEPAVEPLITVIRRDTGMARLSAMPALTGIGLPAVTYLIRELANEDLKVRKDVVSALGSIGDFRAVEPLIGELSAQRLKSPFTENSSRDDHPSAIPNEQLKARYPANSSVKQKRIINAFAEQIRDEAPASNSLYWEVVEALVRIGPPAVLPLIDSLTKPNAQLESGVRLILMRIGQPAVGPLIKTLAHETANIRDISIETLVAIGDPAKEALQTAVSDEDPGIWVGASQALTIIENTISEDEDQSADSHLRVVKPEVQSQTWARPTIQPLKPDAAGFIWSTFGASLKRRRLSDEDLRTFVTDPRMESYGPQIRLRFKQKLRALRDEDVERRLSAVEFFGQVVKIYKEESGKLKTDHSKFLLLSFFSRLVDVSVEALKISSFDTNAEVQGAASRALFNAGDTDSLQIGSMFSARLAGRTEELFNGTATEWGIGNAELKRLRAAKSEVIKRIEELFRSPESPVRNEV